MYSQSLDWISQFLQSLLQSRRFLLLSVRRLMKWWRVRHKFIRRDHEIHNKTSKNISYVDTVRLTLRIFFVLDKDVHPSLVSFLVGRAHRLLYDIKIFNFQFLQKAKLYLMGSSAIMKNRMSRLFLSKYLPVLQNNGSSVTPYCKQPPFFFMLQVLDRHSWSVPRMNFSVKFPSLCFPRVSFRTCFAGAFPPILKILHSRWLGGIEIHKKISSWTVWNNLC